MERMKLRPFLALILSTLPLVAAEAVKPPAPARLNREDLMLWRDEANVIHPVRSVADWQKRRAEILRGMESVMGELPGAAKRCALDVKVDEEVDCGSYV